MRFYLFLCVLLILFKIVLNVKPKMVPTYYDILNVKKDAPRIEIVKSFRKLALKYHPDKNKAPEAKNIMQDVNEAYETLEDEDKRKEYDLKLAGKPLMKYYRKRKNTANGGAGSSGANKKARANGPQHRPIPMIFNTESSNYIFIAYPDRIAVVHQGILHIDNTRKITINGGYNNFQIYGNNLKLSDQFFGFVVENSRSFKLIIHGSANKFSRKDLSSFDFKFDQSPPISPLNDVIINGNSNKFEIYIEYHPKKTGSNLIEIHGSENTMQFSGRNINLNGQKFKMGAEQISKEYFNSGQPTQNSNSFKGETHTFNFGGAQPGYNYFPGGTSQNQNKFGTQSQTWDFGEASKNPKNVPNTFNLFPETPSKFGEQKDDESIDLELKL
uniref:J domain-containing protein n=1 Tax=Meloidogyne incognita TaxID=6306 RepID=A0A914KUM4_MELIC